MSDTLFNDFEQVSAKAWKQKIQTDLKGADYNDTLIWKTIEGIDVKPFYHSDDFKDRESIPIALPLAWKINQSIFVTSAESANNDAIQAIEKGAESLLFIVQKDDISLEKLLEGIDLENIPVHFKTGFISNMFATNLNTYAKHNKASFYLHQDIIGNFVKSGNWYQNVASDHETFNDILSCDSLNSVLSINIDLYQNAGANIVQQLAYGLAHLNEYLNHYGMQLNNTVIFNVAIGSNYFFEIAKLRAIRLLWNSLASEYFKETPECHIHAFPTKRNKTLYDYNTNMLRTTTECMSAILGGANTISNTAYDAIYHKTNDFGERIARNQLLVLKNESYFNTVGNASEGAYYIEELTDKLANKALELFKNIEANGGFIKQLISGTIQRKIKESAKTEQELFDNGTLVLLGTNKYQNQDDRMSHELEIYPFIKTNKRKTLIEPIIENRLAETLEQERLKTEK